MRFGLIQQENATVAPPVNGWQRRIVRAREGAFCGECVTVPGWRAVSFRVIEDFREAVKGSIPVEGSHRCFSEAGARTPPVLPPCNPFSGKGEFACFERWTNCDNGGSPKGRQFYLQ